MTDLIQTPLGRFRLVSMLEGLSYALLVFVAMPLKYGLDMPQMVRMLGRAHGGLFVAFVIALILAAISQRWSIVRTGMLFVASMIPLGAIWIERSCSAESGSE
ncbi:MAG: integral membrane protein [Myxococcota bacterium]|jgi:integral membrane protein